MRTIITTICTSAALCALLLTATTTCHAQTNTRETTKNGHFIVKKRLIDKNTSAQQSAAVIACGGAQVAIDTVWQETPESPAAKKSTVRKKADIFCQTNETFAKFRDGNVGWEQWVKENMRYPEEAKENGVQGRVLITFLVYPDGTTGNAKIIRSVNPALDREAMRLMSIMPKWIPATREGKRIQQRMTVPITFKLD
ncbi:MAG: energy transducer TonB [Prevotella sp.]|nr:energy transducer TonB [Prevotella sp.]